MREVMDFEVMGAVKPMALGHNDNGRVNLCIAGLGDIFPWPDGRPPVKGTKFRLTLSTDPEPGACKVSLEHAAARPLRWHAGNHTGVLLYSAQSFLHRVLGIAWDDDDNNNTYSQDVWLALKLHAGTTTTRRSK